MAAVALLAAQSEAEAALYYWPFDEPGYRPPFFSAPRPSIRRHNAKPIQGPKRDSAKPKGPVIIAISIEKQHLKLYDAEGEFAQSPISTGMNGHPTPMGVFSVIQKQKFHRSNIYSDAPMPYMQRITWSGIAMHAGVVPGYPASHGCIRVPMSFAVKMWKWTKLGARVVITPGETNPTSFSHPLLPTHKVAPQTVAAIAAPVAQVTAHLEKDAQADAIEPGFSQGVRGVRSSVGQSEGANPSGRPFEGQELPAIATQAHTTGASTAVSDGAPSIAKSPPPENANEANAAPGSADTSPPPKRTGQIAVFISRKNSKLYVRQNFTPVFEAPVTIAPDNRPLGTHIFTAQVDAEDPNLLHWSVLSLPMPSRSAGPLHKHKARGASELQVAALPDGPAEALDRLAIPVDAMARITEALSTGGSIIISDQDLRAGETGEGTDFIVPLH